MTEPRRESSSISVITPCHNAAPFVGETIESVLRQSYPAVEHVIIDDASTDESWTVIERYAAAHPERIRAQRLERNRGASHARNRGAEQARGEFLMFLDADDLIAPDTLAALVHAIHQLPNVIAMCPWMRLRQNGQDWLEEPGEVALPDENEDHLRAWLEGRWVPTCSILWRRDVFARSGGWDEELTGNDDGELMMRSFATGTRLVRAAAGTSYYRIHGGSHASLSSGLLHSEPVFRGFMDSLEKLSTFLGARGKLDPYRAAIGTAYYRLPVTNFFRSHPELARECLRRAREYSGEDAVPSSALGRTLPGRILSALLGVEGKERIAITLARVGIMTAERRRVSRIAELRGKARREQP